MRSASHGWDGRSNFARENFGSPNDSLLLLRRFLLFLLFFLLGRRFFRLLRLRGLEGGLLRHPDRQARAAVRPRALPADLLAGLVAHAFVRPDHLHQIDVVPQPDFDLRTDEVQVKPRLPILRPLVLLGRLRGGPRRLLRRRGGRRAFGFGCGLLVRHRVPWERGAPNSERYIRLRSVGLGRRLLRPTAFVPGDEAQVVDIDAGREVAARIAISVRASPRVSLGQRFDGQRGEPNPRGGNGRLLPDGQVQTTDRNRVRARRDFQIDVRAAAEAGILLALDPPAPAFPDGHVEFPPHAHTLQGDLRSEGAPRRIANNPVPDVGGLVGQKRDDVSLQVPAALVAREQETLRPGWFVAAPEDRPTRRANLPETGRLAAPERLLHRKRMVLETECAVEPPRVHVLQTGGQDESIGPALAGSRLDELQQATSDSLPTIRSCDEEV